MYLTTDFHLTVFVLFFFFLSIYIIIISFHFPCVYVFLLLLFHEGCHTTHFLVLQIRVQVKIYSILSFTEMDIYFYKHTLLFFKIQYNTL